MSLQDFRRFYHPFSVSVIAKGPCLAGAGDRFGFFRMGKVILYQRSAFLRRAIGDDFPADCKEIVEIVLVIGDQKRAGSPVASKGRILLA